MQLITAFLCSIIGHWIYSHWMLMVTLSSRHVVYAQAILADWVNCSDTPKDSKRFLQASIVDYHLVHPELCLSLECVNRDLVMQEHRATAQPYCIKWRCHLVVMTIKETLLCVSCHAMVLVRKSWCLTSRIIHLNFVHFFNLKMAMNKPAILPKLPAPWSGFC